MKEKGNDEQRSFEKCKGSLRKEQFCSSLDFLQNLVFIGQNAAAWGFKSVFKGKVDSSFQLACGFII